MKPSDIIKEKINTRILSEGKQPPTMFTFSDLAIMEFLDEEYEKNQNRVEIMETERIGGHGGTYRRTRGLER